jgi:opacity protein-like surface antigen
MRLLPLLLLTALPAFSQHFSAGVKAGVPLTDFVDGARSQDFDFVTRTNRYVIGAQAELHLILGFSVELDALYRHYSYNSTSSSATTGAWEFPLLAKYRFPMPFVRPFVGAGVAWDKLSGLEQSIVARDLNKDTTRGLVFGVGADIHFIVHIQPEIRYTRWGAEHFIGPNGVFNSNQNQAEFLVGITF